jgi:hypothetical protein
MIAPPSPPSSRFAARSEIIEAILMPSGSGLSSKSKREDDGAFSTAGEKAGLLPTIVWLESVSSRGMNLPKIGIYFATEQADLATRIGCPLLLFRWPERAKIPISASS